MNTDKQLGRCRSQLRVHLPIAFALTILMGLFDAAFAQSQWTTNGNNINNTNTGNVGIGTANPNFKLEVNGEINATGVRINGAPITGGAVSSVFGRTGAVVQQAGDYTWRK